MYKLVLFLRKGPATTGKLFLLSVLLWVSPGRAFLSEILEAKKQVEGYAVTLKSLADTLEEVGGLEDAVKEYQAYEKELRDLQRTVDEYEKLGLDVRNFTEMRNYNPNSIRGQIDFFKRYARRANNLLKDFQSLMGSPETITASEQIETNRTLRALLKDSQTKELRRLRKEIAAQRILLERKRKEQEFIGKQYSYINRHSKGKGFGVFHPFQSSDKNRTEEKKKRKKFLGIF